MEKNLNKHLRKLSILHTYKYIILKRKRIININKINSMNCLYYILVIKNTFHFIIIENANYKSFVFQKLEII
ncbi:hypothetical protein PFAG_05681 [Plasmodium falciparum Santa Lucia]|uniref:Uncharacterized protein n=6 Tax=Plasmodium falciparum TaxID=5833 RepID=A0A024W0L9_PLAFA|nr:hypothetical protein PFFVO_05216 [Plasmodium falciparum Vietnam Oak-Knoll (FVO)]ETW33701.1 hypothetical protein PFTANZ_05564 [Plasmodium falciparum Tanzania (2000708)]ETW39666.1 hypothetical protein PFNF135_05695 [Plasmodium falciparum NF135/5.C10]ETW46518.1 hypothetical protein PFMALIP_05422 [Plasmodium falciparum MaliPS096_E11]EUR62437.1 hypothetical protein PFBG_05648 [Plasmodium falciparum 7G8]EUT79109.1 hypothetical protein PFAG_05681 [Plasmodium falciparum Santa Lucia]